MSGDVGVARGREPEPRAEPELARRRVQQVRAAHDLADPLRGVVDDDGEVVGVDAVVAAHDEVVDDAGDLPGEPVGEADARRVGADAQRRRAAAASRSARSAAVSRGRCPG